MPVDPSLPPPVNTDQALADRLANIERRLRALETIDQSAVPVVDALPAFGRKGRVVMLSTDNRLYRDTGAAWVVGA